jgi:hypothetical protein
MQEGATLRRFSWRRPVAAARDVALAGVAWGAGIAEASAAQHRGTAEVVDVRDPWTVDGQLPWTRRSSWRPPQRSGPGAADPWAVDGPAASTRRSSRRPRSPIGVRRSQTVDSGRPGRRIRRLCAMSRLDTTDWESVRVAKITGFCDELTDSWALRETTVRRIVDIESKED